MLDRVPIRRDEGSQWYSDNLKIVEAWEAFAQKHNGRITGIVNGITINFELDFNFKGKNVNVVGMHIMSNGVRNVSDPEDAFTKNTVVTISSSHISAGKWSIQTKSRVRDFVHGFTGTSLPLEYNHNFSFYTKESAGSIRRVISREDFELIQHISDLRSIKFEESRLAIEYFNLIEVNDLELILEQFAS